MNRSRIAVCVMCVLLMALQGAEKKTTSWAADNGNGTYSASHLNDLRSDNC